MRDLLRHPASERHGPASDVVQDVQEPVPLHVPVQVVPHQPQEQVSHLPANVGVVDTSQYVGALWHHVFFQHMHYNKCHLRLLTAHVLFLVIPDCKKDNSPCLLHI